MTTQTILGKYCGRAFSNVTQLWKEQNGFGLGVVFIYGFFCHSYKNISKSKERWSRVDRLTKEVRERVWEVNEESEKYERILMRKRMEEFNKKKN